jgi:hypothetical protein
VTAWQCHGQRSASEVNESKSGKPDEGTKMQSMTPNGSSLTTISRWRKSAATAPILAAMILTSLLGASSAKANVVSVYPAAMHCIYQSGGAVTAVAGMLENRTGTPSNVACSVDLLEGPNLTNIGVLVWDGSGGGGITCKVRATELVITAVDPRGYVITEQTLSSVVPGEWEGMNFAPVIVPGGASMHVTMNCLIPAANGNTFSKLGHITTNQ